jgi:hypothetical protein
VNETILLTPQAQFAANLQQKLDSHGSVLLPASEVRDTFPTWRELRAALEVIRANLRHDPLLDLVTFWDLGEGEKLPDTCPVPALLPSKNRWRKLKRYGTGVVVEELPDNQDVSPQLGGA